MTERLCRWGILSTANIAKKNWQGMRLAGNATLAAVASGRYRRRSSSSTSCQSHVPFATAPKALGSLRGTDRSERHRCDLHSAPDRDADEWVIKAANAKKHVLVEKTSRRHGGRRRKNSRGVQAEQRAVHGRRDVHAQCAIVKNAGDARRWTERRSDSPHRGPFSFLGTGDFLQQNIRVSKELEPLGCLGDLGWYTIRFALWAMKYQMPVSSLAGRSIR